MTGNQVFTSNPELRSKKWRGRYPIIARQLPRLFCSLYELYAGDVHSMDPLNLSKYPTCSSGDNLATQEALSDVTRRHDLNNVAWHLRLSYKVLSESPWYWAKCEVWRSRPSVTFVVTLLFLLNSLHQFIELAKLLVCVPDQSGR